MTKQVLKVEADDFAQVVSCVGFVTNVVAVALPDGPQKTLGLQMGNDLIHLVMKYSNEKKQKHLKGLLTQLNKDVLTEMANEADTSVPN